MAYSGGQQVFSPYAAMGNSPGMMIDPNGELTKDAQPVQDNGMDYAGLDAMAVRAFMDGVMGGLYNIGFMYGSNTMLMAGGGGSGVQNVGGREWLPKYTDNMNMCNVFRAALSDVPGDIVGIKGFTIAPDNSIYVTYSYVTHSSRPAEEGEYGGTYNLIDQYALSERTTKFSLPPRGDLQKQQQNGRNPLATPSEYYFYGTLTPSLIGSFVNDTKYGRWASMGDLTFSAAPYSKQVALVQETITTGSYVRSATKIIGITGRMFTLASDGIGVYNYYRYGANSQNAVSPFHMAVDGVATYAGGREPLVVLYILQHHLLYGLLLVLFRLWLRQFQMLLVLSLVGFGLDKFFYN